MGWWGEGGYVWGREATVKCIVASKYKLPLRRDFYCSEFPLSSMISSHTHTLTHTHTHIHTHTGTHTHTHICTYTHTHMHTHTHT